MILTILSHLAAVKILFVIGITLIVLPIIFYKLVLKGNELIKKWMPKAITLGIIFCLPMIYYVYIDIRYDASDFSLNDKLYLAAENKNYDAAKRFIEDGAVSDEKTRYGRSAIYRSVMLDDTEMVRLFVESGADVNYTNGENKTLLAIACENQCNENVRLLLNAGAEPDYRSGELVPALHYAAANDKGYNSELIRMLIDAGADPASIAYRDGKAMLAYRYYFDRRYEDDDITPEEEQAYGEIYDMLYDPYIDWLVEKMTAENEMAKANK